MSEEFDAFEGMDDLSFQQKQDLEDLIVDTAFRNSFMIITGRSSIEKMFSEESNDKATVQALCAHNPDEDPSMDTLENMMYYFVDTEEYEKCAEIRDIIDARKAVVE